MVDKIADELEKELKLRRALGAGNDDVNNPSHYTSHPSGIECIEITEHMDFTLGNAVKYIWRAGLKSNDPVKDLEKAVWYLNRKIDFLKKYGPDY